MITDRLSRPILLETPALLSELSAWNEHTPFALWLIDVLRPKFLVELGTHSGVSYCAFCQAISHLHLPTQCYAVDTWQGDAHARNYGEEIYQNLKAHHDPRYRAFSTLMRTTFDDAANQFQDGSVDLLHIDGYHTYDAAKHDFETWLPKMSPTGVILFHDVTGRSVDFGVWRLWDEVAARFPSFHFVHASGLGVAAVGQEPPEAIRWLAALADNEISEVRAFFARRGAVADELLQRQRLSVELGRQLVKLEESNNQVASLKIRDTDAQKAIETLSRDLAETRQINTQRQAQTAQEITRMVERLGAAHKRIEELDLQAAMFDSRVAAALAQIYSSTSWRVTAPLRAVSRAAKALLGR